ncbi:ricin-type beta-trefoil lectin domain protein [Asticcacaulis sp.]|uniref:ricin-type beta-trefoil lectin domain protein n=1 Tax=Asticcacaulis sp. TaxID=1872648 RepID=UPI003F7C3AF4
MKHLIGWLALVAACLATPAFAQTPAGQLSVGSKFIDGACLEGRASDDTLVVNKCSAQPEQGLRIDDETGLIHHGDTQCLVAVQKGQPLALKPCADVPEQKWTFEADGTLKSDSGLCADILNFRKDPGTSVIAWDCTATDNQKFFATNVRLSASQMAAAKAQKAAPQAAAPVASGQPVIASYFVSGRCFAISGTKSELEYDNCDRKPNQSFHFKGGVSGEIVQDGQCLTSVMRGEPLALKPCAGKPEQDWVFGEDGALRNRADLCADVFRFDVRVHTSVIAWACTGTDNQKWYPAVAVAAGTYAPGTAITDAVKTDNTITTVSTQGGWSVQNMTASGGKTLSAEGDKITGGQNDTVLVGGAGAQLSKFGGLAGANVKGANVSILPKDWGFFSGDTAGQINQ